MNAPDEVHRQLASAAWRALFDFFIRTRAQRDRALARLHLTPNDAKVLATLQERDGVRMSELAETWGTEASTATWAVTRLEERGLVERAPLESDRRVKIVRLSRRGSTVAERLRNALYEPPPEIESLGSEDLEALSAILVRAGTSRGAGR